MRKGQVVNLYEKMIGRSIYMRKCLEINTYENVIGSQFT